MTAIDVVKNYYGAVLKSTEDLKTMACCTPAGLPSHVKALLENIHPEVLAKYYGCGLIVPELVQGRRVLDLGCGSGRDVYAIAQLAGGDGEVVGVDVTPEQLATAQHHRDWHMNRFGFRRSMVRFFEGNIEDLAALELEPGTFDVVVSNCVINLSSNKPAVFKGVFDLLKQGGEFYFADVYCDRRLPDSVRNHEILYGECLGGALYWADFQSIARRAGFRDPRLVTSRTLEITDEALASLVGNARFYSATYRLFKIDGLEEECEDYGQAVVYNGGIPGASHDLSLDGHHKFETGRIVPVCGNTWNILKQSRYASYFEFIGDFSTHYGIFPGCGTSIPFSDDLGGSGPSSSCC